jgi:hypothetical protein
MYLQDVNLQEEQKSLIAHEEKKPNQGPQHPNPRKRRKTNQNQTGPKEEHRQKQITKTKTIPKHFLPATQKTKANSTANITKNVEITTPPTQRTPYRTLML